MKRSRTRATIDYLRTCQSARAHGLPAVFTTDPAWLVNVAINRRAGWPDDPGLAYGSAMPVNGRYPKRASDQAWFDLARFARAVNTPRLIVRANECRHIDPRIRARVAHRITEDWPI
jgi:hypothetical protein